MAVLLLSLMLTGAGGELIRTILLLSNDCIVNEINFNFCKLIAKSFPQDQKISFPDDDKMT